MEKQEKKHKAGFVNIVGNPNVGKSTLMNKLVGERLSIITSKSQTTRHRIMGIVNGDDFQIVYSDTPGVVKPNYKLQEAMLNFSKSALGDADILLYVTDVFEKADKNEDFLEMVRSMDIPVLLVLNKIDLIDQKQLDRIFALWGKLLPKAEIYPASALHKFNTANLFDRILELLPESPPFYDKDQLTDKPARFFVTEIIRGRILMQYQKEIPYAVEVVVESFVEEENIIRISSLIIVERESQKGIIIGAQGKTLKFVATDSRKDLEKFFEKKVFLQVFVKVDKDWRSKDYKLKQYGYRED